MWTEILIVCLSILFSAFFSGLEIAFVSSNKLHIELEKKRTGFYSTLLAKLTSNPSRFITTMLVGNNLALVIYSYYMGELIIQSLPLDGLGDTLVLLLQTLISTFVILITAEFLPKAIFRIYSNESLKLFAIPAYFFYSILFAVTRVITWISDILLKWFFNIEESELQTEFSKAELGSYISQQLDGGANKEELDAEIQIFQNALEFHDVKAREVMVPRTELIAVEIHENITKLKDLFIETGHSKILVYKDTLDDIVGYVPAFGLFKKPKSLKSMIMPVELIPESMLTGDILNLLIKKRKSLAVVLDEYGGTSGIITVEDIIEELFGEIEDEHDKVILKEEVIDEGKFLFSARLEIDYLNEQYEMNLPVGEGYETLGGLIIEFTEDIPQAGSLIEIGDYIFKIIQVSSSRIEEIELERKAE